jgi:hypothetical protein
MTCIDSWTAAGRRGFEGLQLDSQAGDTLLSGTLADQSALHGILNKVRDLGLCIITVRRLPPEHTGEEPR